MNEEKIPTVQEIVERYLPGVDWKNPIEGRCRCPGHTLHTHQPAKRDCKVFANGTPTVYCFHDKCRDVVQGVNDKIRTAWGLFQPPTDEKVLAELREKKAKQYELEVRAKGSLPMILKNFKWDVADLEEDNMFPEFEDQFVCFFRTLYDARDTIWIGNPEDSGMPQHESNFKMRGDWDRESPASIGRYTTASTFKPGSFSRSNANVVETPYLIVEGDKILGEPNTEEEKLANKNACGAIFQWMKSSCGMELRAVVDTGNKSLHSWWNMPNPEKLEELKIVLPAMGCDRAMFKPSQPARIPGVVRDNGNLQRLLYLN